ncbi:MAG: glycosyltransferase [Bdellovibrionia bacterium]
MRPLRILTWHVHGSYLYYLTQVPHIFYLPVPDLPVAQRADGYHGRTKSYAWPDNVIEVPVSEVKNLSLDCILFQSQRNYLEDQHQILSDTQRSLPRIYLEHDPPRESPTDTHHIVDDPNVMLVHVTSFNRLMWDARRTPTRVIEHGVSIPEGVRYVGEKERGLVVVNNIKKRGRRLGYDIYEHVRREIPLDLVGMGWFDAGGLGEISHAELPLFSSHYRFFFNPIRYTSLGLSICEAMMTGIPIVGLATTELATVIENGVSGFIDTDPDCLIDVMKELLNNPELARHLGHGARQTAMERFSIDRFVNDWTRTFEEVV